MDDQKSPATPMSGDVQGYAAAYTNAQHSSASMTIGNQSQLQTPMETSIQGHLGGPDTHLTPAICMIKPQPGEPTYEDAQTLYLSRESSHGHGEHGGNLSFVADPSSAYQAEDTSPPEYERGNSSQCAVLSNDNSNDVADQSRQATSSEYQREGPPPSYRI